MHGDDRYDRGTQSSGRRPEAAQGARIRTTEALLKKAASTRPGRRELAQTTELPERSILEWVNRADLMRVKGVGEEYSDLLEAAGVDTIKELRRRNSSQPARHDGRGQQRKKRLVRRLPTEAMVSRWVDYAKTLDPIVRVLSPAAASDEVLPMHCLALTGSEPRRGSSDAEQYPNRR